MYSKAGLLARNQFASRRSRDRPTRSSFSKIFLGPRANAELAPIIYIALHASKAALTKINLNFFLRLTQPSRRDQNFATMLPSTHKTQPSSLFPLLHTPITLPSSLPNALPRFQSSYTRTSGHSLGTFRTRNLPDSP